MITDLIVLDKQDFVMRLRKTFITQSYIMLHFVAWTKYIEARSSIRTYLRGYEKRFKATTCQN